MLVNQLKDKKEFHILSSLLLRSMQKAIYDTNNIGHFGLASERYTHFTSPIRRFPDTTVHRLLRKYLFKAQIDKDSIMSEEQKLPYIAEHSSKKERDSIDCEREVDDMKKAEYMMDHIGEKYTGMISGITSFGMFIELPNLIEGLIKIDSLTDDVYTFDESTITLKGKKNKRGYRLGDNVDVVVVAANKEAKTIDFQIDKKVLDFALETEKEIKENLLLTKDYAEIICQIIIEFTSRLDKYKYENSKKQKENKKKQREANLDIKEYRLSVTIDVHDFNTRVRNSLKYLEKGHKVKVSVRFKGREMAHTELGREVLERFADALKEVSDVEQKPKMDGRFMTMMLIPKKEK